MNENKTESIDWQEYFKTLQYAGKGSKNTYLVSLDTEYTQATKYTNICLSYQISVLRTEDDEYQEVFIDVKNDERLTLLELIQETLKKFDQVEVGGKTRIILIAHNSIAEISMLADFEKYIHNLQIIRRTLTTKRPIKLEDDGDIYSIELYDSMLIAPVGFYSLKKLGSILGNKDMMKIDISQNDIENMDKYKLSNFTEFKEYAMQDTRVTLAVWLALQTQLNELVTEPITADNKNNNVKNARKVKYYKTLGSAAVQAFLTYMEYKEFDKNENIYFSYFIKDILTPRYGYIDFISSNYFNAKKDNYFIHIDKIDFKLKKSYISQLGDNFLKQDIKQFQLLKIKYTKFIHYNYLGIKDNFKINEEYLNFLVCVYLYGTDQENILDYSYYYKNLATDKEIHFLLNNYLCGRSISVFKECPEKYYELERKEAYFNHKKYQAQRQYKSPLYLKIYNQLKQKYIDFIYYNYLGVMSHKITSINHNYLDYLIYRYIVFESASHYVGHYQQYQCNLLEDKEINFLINNYYHGEIEKFYKRHKKDTSQMFFINYNEKARELKNKYHKVLTNNYYTGVNDNFFYNHLKKYHLSLAKYHSFINNTYFGGRNESFYIGYTQDDEAVKDKYIFVDIDFSGAYPTGICTIPKVSNEVEECVSSNKMIHRWYKSSQEVKNVVIVGFADVAFNFPKDINLPSIPVKHKQYGLIYPLEGETLVTAVEIVFFIEQLKIYDPNIDIDKHITVKKSIELLPELNDDKPDLLLKRYFQDKILKREKVKEILKNKDKHTKEEIDKAKLNDKLLKELVNSAYGKFGQSINKKNTYDLAKGITKPLTKSPITSPYIASTTTGVVRAALSALIYTVEAYNNRLLAKLKKLKWTTSSEPLKLHDFQYQLNKFCKKSNDTKEKLLLISATTDGALLGIPLGSIDQSKINYTQPDTTKIDVLLPDFIDELEGFYPIQLLKQTRASFGKGYLEVKHLATEIFSVKTRGQIGYLRDPETNKRKVSVLAKFGHKPPLSDLYEKETYKAIMANVDKRNEADGKWLARKYKQIKQKHKDIKTYKVRTLIGARKIFDEHEPYQDLVGINVEKKINFDYDYKRLLKDGDPHTQPYKNLKEMLKHRYAMEAVRKRGINANSELVEAKVQTNNTNVRIRGSLYDHALKMTLRGIFSKENSLSKQKIKAQDAVDKINAYLKENKADVKLINENTIKNAKRFKFEPNTIPSTPSLKEFVKTIYSLLEMPYDSSYSVQYFAKDTRVLDQLNTPSEKLAFRVFLQWIFKASSTQNKNLPIFGKLDLPPVEILKEELIGCIQGTELSFNDDELQEYISEAINYKSNLKYNHIPNTKGSKAVIQQMRLAIYRYIPDIEKAGKSQRQKKMFIAKDFNNLLLERIDFITVKKNPAKESCLKYFLLAYLNDIAGFESRGKIKKHTNTIIIDRLASFGLTKTKFYQIKKDKFIYKALKDTPENRAQVRNMCKRLEIESNPTVMNALL